MKLINALALILAAFGAGCDRHENHGPELSEPVKVSWVGEVTKTEGLGFPAVFGSIEVGDPVEINVSWIPELASGISVNGDQGSFDFSSHWQNSIGFVLNGEVWELSLRQMILIDAENFEVFTVNCRESAENQSWVGYLTFSDRTPPADLLDSLDVPSGDFTVNTSSDGSGSGSLLTHHGSSNDGYARLSFDLHSFILE